MGPEIIDHCGVDLRREWIVSASGGAYAYQPLSFYPDWGNWFATAEQAAQADAMLSCD